MASIWMSFQKVNALQSEAGKRGDKMKRIGVLAMQGAVAEHMEKISKLGALPVKIRRKEELAGLAGLILPGGESTTMTKLLREFSLLKPLQQKIRGGLPVWGTCAGLILLAKEVVGQAGCLQSMDIRVKRNGYGGQLESFRIDQRVTAVSKEPLPLVFIRAPQIIEAGPEVRILSRVRGHIAAAEERNMLVTAFHPELSDDLSFHRYFLKTCQN